ncbi:MAG: sensor domain-containing diguanylate cyclase [Betaproteobacteria bacterium]|nr:sensor domain-containing diguanylate cyclase [Betaproteobacteria bacterium]
MSWREHGFSKVIEQIPLGVAVTRLDGTLEYANAYLLKLIGARGEELVGAPLSRFVRPAVVGPHGEPRDPLGAAQNPRREVRIFGSEETLDMLESVYPVHDSAGALTHFIHLLQDISAHKQVGVLSALAFYDSLTGLPNRNLLKDRLERAVAAAKRNRGAFAVLYMDIDHFKRINDELGHEAGDELLRQIAVRLRQSLRASDSIARWGGDEFVALLDGIGDPQFAGCVTRKLLAACSGPYLLGGVSRRITLSIGVSFYPRDAQDVTTLLDCADQAMYAVKARGRNGYHVLEEPGGRYLITA